MEENKRFGTWHILLIMTLIIGGMIIAFFAILNQQDRKKKKDWIEAEGTIVDYKTEKSWERKRTGSKGYHYVYRYWAEVEYEVNGEKHTITSKISTNKAPVVGKSKKVIYDPVFPWKAEVVSDNGYSFENIGLVLSIVATVYLSVCALLGIWKGIEAKGIMAGALFISVGVVVMYMDIMRDESHRVSLAGIILVGAFAGVGIYDVIKSLKAIE